jgi:hypothetical protein
MLKLRWPGVCAACGAQLGRGDSAEWDSATHELRCVACVGAHAEPSAASTTTSTKPAMRPPRAAAAEIDAGASREQHAATAFDRGQPGASVAREYARRRGNREARTLARHPWVGGLLLTLGSAPRHESSFREGERGELAVAAALEQHAARGPAIVLHDRRMPGGRGNIDHLAIAPSGVFVIDAKNIRGKVRIVKPVFGEQRLMIEGRNRTRLIDGLDRQVGAVRGALESGGYAEIPLRGVLCFTTADLPLLGTLSVRDHLLLYRRGLAKRLNARGALEGDVIATLARVLADALPSA